MWDGKTLKSALNLVGQARMQYLAKIIEFISLKISIEISTLVYTTVFLAEKLGWQCYDYTYLQSSQISSLK